MADNLLFESRMDCPVCESTQHDLLREVDFDDPLLWDFLEKYYDDRIPVESLAGAKFEVVQCRTCSFVWQKNILNDQGMELLYSRWISGEKSLDKKESSGLALYAGYARQAEAIAPLLKKKPADIKVLDFGMGWGRWCLMAKAYGYQVYGLEISSERLAYARGLGLQVTDKVEDLAEERFDFINSEQVFEHVPNPRENITYLVSKLKTGGVLRISVPNGAGVAKAIRRPDWKPTNNAVHPLEHINCFTNETLIHLASSVGLKVGEQPRLLGQGLLGKSYGFNLKSWLTSLFGRYYRRNWGTTLYFYLPE